MSDIADLIASIGSVKVRDAADAQIIAGVRLALQELARDNAALRIVVDDLQHQLAAERLKAVP